MNDEFLIQVDEEVPSDQRVAVNILETRVMSEEYREKLEMLLDKVEKISLTSNIDILDEMKNILNDMLASIISINKNYTFVSEMMLKINDMIEQNDSGEFVKILENNYNSLYEKVSRLDEKLNEIYLDVGAKLSSPTTDLLKEGLLNISSQFKDELSSLDEKLDGISLDINEKISFPTSIDGVRDKMEELSLQVSEDIARLDNKTNAIHGEIGKIYNRLEEKLEEMSVINAAIDSKVDDKLGDIKIESKRLEEKVGEMSVRNAEAMSKFDEKLYDIHTAGKVMSEKVEEIGSIYAAAADVLTDINEASTSILSRIEKIEAVLEKLTATKVRYVRKIKARRKARPRKPSRRRKQIKDEALDILIVNTLKNVSMNMGSLKTSTSIGEKRLRNRLEVLMTRGVIARERRGRSIFYVSRVDEASELDN